MTDIEKLTAYKARLSDILRRSRWWDCDSVDEKRRILQGLVCPVRTLRLFRYCGCHDYVFENIAHGRMTLSNPKCFNDPYDCQFYADPNQIEESFRRWTLDKFRACVVAARKGKTGGIFEDAGSRKLFDILAQYPDEILEEKIYSRYGEIQKRGFEDECLIPARLRRRVRVACLSEKGDSPPMWAHYAQCGNGFCLEYEVPTDFEMTFHKSGLNRDLLISLVPVLYSHERYDATHIIEEKTKYLVARSLNVIDQLDMSRFDRLDYLKLVAFKSCDWQYENEWRMIATPFSPVDPDFIDITAPPIRRVILGNDMSVADVERLERSLREYVNVARCPVHVQRIAVDSVSRDYSLNFLDMMTLKP